MGVYHISHYILLDGHQKPLHANFAYNDAVTISDLNLGGHD